MPANPNPPSGNCSTPETQGAEVVQEDRDRADLWWTINHELPSPPNLKMAFARHRIAANAASEARATALQRALRDIAMYDVGLQALMEDGEDTPERVVKYYASQVERRRKIARAALGADNADTTTF